MEGEAHLKEKEPNLYHNVLKMRMIHGAENCKLWSEDMIKQLLSTTEYQGLLETYNNYPHFIMQLHLAKYIILHHCGGFCVDIDCEPKQNLYKLIDYKDSSRTQLPLVVTDVDEYCCNIKSNKKFINNHFMYVPYSDHPLMKILLEEAPKAAKRKPLEPHLKWVMRSVGPYFLTKCVKKYKIMTQRELKKSSHQELIHDVVSQHKSQYLMTRSPSRLSFSNLSQSFSKSELKGKVHTSDVVNLYPASSLDLFLNHKERNIWLNEEWLRDLKIANRAKLTTAQVAVIAICIGVLVVAL